MVTAADWPDKFAPGTSDWFAAMRAALAEAQVGKPNFDDLLEAAKTQDEGKLLFELAKRAKK